MRISAAAFVLSVLLTACVHTASVPTPPLGDQSSSRDAMSWHSGSFVFVRGTDAMAGQAIFVFRSPRVAGTFNLPPSRKITSPDLSNDVGYSMATDANGYLYVLQNGIFFPNPRILVFAPMANGASVPVRVITDTHTPLLNPIQLDVEANGAVYVTNNPTSGIPMILEYAAGANGNVSPIRHIIPSGVQNGSINGVAVGASRVYGTFTDANGLDAILMYPKNANGTVAPTCSIPANTGFPTFAGPSNGRLAKSPFNKLLWTTGDLTTGSGLLSFDDCVKTPVDVLGGFNGMANFPIDMALDGKLNLYVALFTAGVNIYFPNNQHGIVMPDAVISGSNTQLSNSSLEAITIGR